MKLIKNILNQLKSFYKGEKKLISELKSDHKKLFSLFDKINKHIQKKKYSKIPDLLKSFHYEYRLHIIYEDNYFYTKMKTIYKNNEHILKFINDKQEEMKYISKKIVGLIDRYDSVHEIKRESFKKEFAKLGEALKKRIEFEEKELYTLYT